jgi:hypothetical protein
MLQKQRVDLAGLEQDLLSEMTDLFGHHALQFHCWCGPESDVPILRGSGIEVILE